MSLSEEQLSKTAKLARLKLQESEISGLTQRIDSILSMVDQMQAVDTANIDPMANPLDAVQILREDKVDESIDKLARREQFLNIAPATQDGLFLVPKVIE